MQNERARNNKLNTVPSQQDDGSIAAIVSQRAYVIGRHKFIEVAVPSSIASTALSGRLLMARCSESSSDGRRIDWSIYLRRPLFISGIRAATNYPDATALTLNLPATDDPGYQWLKNREAGDVVNLLGPFGRHPALAAQSRHLLLIASPAYVPLLLLPAEEMLDRGGRVTVLVRSDHIDDSLPKLFPLAIEIQVAREKDWRATVGQAVKWADSVLIADPANSPQTWADLLRQHRLRLDDNYANIYVPSDLLCCTGACMSCVVERSNGSLTRACIHGPFFSLTSLVE